MDDAVRLLPRRLFGGNLKQIYWTMGAYDIVSGLEAPDDESATAFALAVSSLGNLRTSTLRLSTPRRCARSSQQGSWLAPSTRLLGCRLVGAGVAITLS